MGNAASSKTSSLYCKFLQVVYHCRSTQSDNLNNETWAKIWFIHRILQFNSYPLQCTLLPYLHIAAFASSIVQSSATAHQPPGRSVAVPVLPSLQLMKMGFLQYTFHFGVQK